MKKIFNVKQLAKLSYEQPQGLEDYIIYFGKYRGRTYNELSDDYIKWAQKTGLPPVYLKCRQCGKEFHEVDVPSENLKGVQSDELGRDVLVYICPACKKETTSIRWK